MAPSDTSGNVFESSVERTRSLIQAHSLLSSPSVIRHRSLQVFSHKNSEPRLGRAFGSMSATTSASPTKPAKKEKSKKSKRGRTILRLVPITNAPAPIPVTSIKQQDVVVAANPEYQESTRQSPLSDNQSTSSLTQNDTSSLPRSSGSVIRSPTAAGKEIEMPQPGRDPRTTVGLYKHGMIRWQRKDGKIKGTQIKAIPEDDSSKSVSVKKSGKPIIQLIIPKDQRNRPLPSLPFFGSSNNNQQVNSATAEFGFTQVVSPPSGSNNVAVRDSLVSPLSNTRPRHSKSFSVSSEYSEYNPSPPRHRKSFSQSSNYKEHGHLPITLQQETFPVSNSSEEDHCDDASSVYSQRSSRTSVDENSHEDDRDRSASVHARNVSGSSVKSSARAGEFDEQPNSENDETPAELFHQEYPPLRSTCAHPLIEEDALFRPTCALRYTRHVSNNSPYQHKPANRRQSSNRSSSGRSLNSPRNMGVIDQAIARSETRMSPTGASPTMSEVAEQIEKHLTTFGDSNALKIQLTTSPVLMADEELAPSPADSTRKHLISSPQKEMEVNTPFSAADTDAEVGVGTAYTSDNPFKWDDFVDEHNLENGFQLKSAPTLPRKSSKRHSQIGHLEFRLSHVPCDHIASQIKRTHSKKRKDLTINIPELSQDTDDFFLSPMPVPPKDAKRSITATVAENVILAILRNLESLDDLFVTAVLNRGFYRVFKRHELELMKLALRKTSGAAWEHREICYPGHDDEDPEDDRPRLEYTPTSYLQYYMRDIYIIAAIKSLIKDKCQSFMRPEISVALVSNDEVESARVDDALWRIWTFCKIFGSGKGREEDITAQMDWLNGGALVHQTCTASIMMTSFDINDTMATAPECFGKGNADGLAAEQLYDMMELWNCLGVLLQPLSGKTVQAREFGVFDNTHIRGGDIDGEEMMLDEWYYYLLTLGLSPILDLATPCRQRDPTAFMLAQDNGWIDWKPPVFGGTRRNFLKEAASRVYEDKIANVYAASSTQEVQRQISKQRIQRHISDLQRRKNSGERLLEVRMSQERPMSEMEGVLNRLNAPRPGPSANIATHIPDLRSAAPESILPGLASMPELPAEPVPTSTMRQQAPLERTVAMPLLPTPPPSTAPSRYAPSIIHSIPSLEDHPAFRNSIAVPSMPALDEHPFGIGSEPGPTERASTAYSIDSHPAFRKLHERDPSTAPSVESHPALRNIQPERAPSAPPSESSAAFQQHPLQRDIHQGDLAENSADRAVYRIVEMGFTPEQARLALRKTDLGDGLRVDRAVEFLLTQA